MAPDTIGIVGAGPAGLAAAWALQRRGLPFEILDAGRGVGGIWDIDRDETPMYESAHFISSKTLSALPGHPMPEDYPDYPRHDRILEYIRSFASRHALDRHAVFGVRVVRAERVDGAASGWRVETDDGQVRHYRALVLATGANWHPVVPDVPGEFEGEAYHAFEYRSPGQFEGRRVLVVGAGNSGCDIVCDAARSAAAAFLSLRRGYHFVPKYVFGTPSDVFADRGPKLPAWLERRVFGFLLRRIVVGDLTRFGLPEPDHDILESHPILNSHLLHHLGHGDVAVRGDVAELTADGVRFADGREEAVDTIVWATGYQRRYPFLADGTVPRRDEAYDLYLNVADRTSDDLFVMGLFETDGAAYPLFGLQARLIASALGALSEDRRAAYDRRRASERPDLRGGRRYLQTRRHRHYVQADAYGRQLEKELRRLGADA
ncbi:MAG: NAD(P)-binding domain-containing protein [Gemmatimonadetes bacterium]|nr:NAD(P)-binding domain-containing protein [Gemmatimonadota bacterium]